MPMKKLGVILFLAGLAAVMVAAGCGTDDSKPVVTRLYASEACGVAPLSVEFRADASGGAPGDPTGGNSFLKMNWNFGDGSPVTSGSSIAYHSYADPDTYLVTVTAEDDDGNVSAPVSRPVVVLADSLAVSGFATFVGEPVSAVSPCQPIVYSIRAHACDFEPDTGFYERFLYTWTFNQAGGTVISHDARPVHRFTPGTLGPVEVQLLLEDPGRSITRRITVPVDVLEAQGTDVVLTGDWLNDGETISPTLMYPATSDTVTLTLALQLGCAGPDPAFGLRVRGRLFVDPNVDIGISGYTAPQGDEFVYSAVDSVGVTVRTFDWSVSQLDAGETHEVRLRVFMPYVQFNVFYDSYYAVESYACDGNGVNNHVRGRIQGS